MRVLLIMTSLFFSMACRRENLIIGKTVSAIDQKSFLTIKHEENNSQLRNKLLNSLVEEKFPSERVEFQLKKLDELDGYKISDQDLRYYAEKERTLSKVVVSYTDRVEIYFLPERVATNQIISKLNLMPEHDRIFRWKKNTATWTVPGQELFLASVNSEDLALNDQRFYQSSSNDKKIKFFEGQRTEVVVNFNYLIQKEKVLKYSGKSMKCTHDMQEAGMCGKCEYKKIVASEEFTPQLLANIADLGLSFNINDQVYDAWDLNPVRINDQQFVIKLKRESGNLEVLPNTTDSIIKRSVGFDYADSCMKRDDVTDIEFQTKSELHIEFKIYGRGIEALKNIL